MFIRPSGQHFPLAKHQKNELFRAIESGGIPITEFKLAETVGHAVHVQGQFTPSPYVRVTLIYHADSQSGFAIHQYRPGRFEVDEYIGPHDRQVQQRVFYKGRQWQTVVTMVEEWVARIGEYQAALAELLANEDENAPQDRNAPNLWTELHWYREHFTGPHERNLENTPFTSAEQATISEQIRQIEAYIKTAHQLTSEQITRVEARLSHAEEASRHMGRKDWLILFNGAVFSLILTDTITQETAQHVILMALHGLGHLFGIGGPPPYLSPGG